MQYISEGSVTIQVVTRQVCHIPTSWNIDSRIASWGPVEFKKSWAFSILARHGYLKRKASNWTSEDQGTKQIDMVKLDDKKEVTALLDVLPSGELLPPQVLQRQDKYVLWVIIPLAAASVMEELTGETHSRRFWRNVLVRSSISSGRRVLPHFLVVHVGSSKFRLLSGTYKLPSWSSWKLPSETVKHIMTQKTFPLLSCFHEPKHTCRSQTLFQS